MYRKAVLETYKDRDLALDWDYGMTAGDLLDLYASHAIDHVAQIEKTMAACVATTRSA